jgi:hypothetical protein
MGDTRFYAGILWFIGATMRVVDVFMSLMNL